MVYYHSFSLSIHHKKQPGAILHPGTLVAILDLDDASCITKALPFTGSLPQGKKESVSLKSNQLFQAAVQSLQAIMAGYSVPDEQILFGLINENVEQFLKTLKDPTLPMLETKVHFIIIIIIYLFFVSRNCCLPYLVVFPLPWRPVSTSA